jgi:hypothetical protein
MAEQLLSLVASLQEDLIIMGGVFALIGVGLFVMYQKGFFRTVEKGRK